MLRVYRVGTMGVLTYYFASRLLQKCHILCATANFNARCVPTGVLCAREVEIVTPGRENSIKRDALHCAY